MSDDDEESRRQIARRRVRAAGDHSARLAKALMEAPASAVAKLELDDELREVVDRARGVTSHIARRRAERGLAGALRGVDDLGDLAARLATIQETGMAAPRLFQLAERWRARLIEEGEAAAAEFPGGPSPELTVLIEKARRERDIGKPPGAARALFRHVIAALEAAQRAPGDPAD